MLAGIAAESAEQNIAAKYLLADVTLDTIVSDPMIPYEGDEATRLILDSHDTAAFYWIANMSVGAFHEHLLSDTTDSHELRELASAVTPEIAAAVSKLMRNHDLIRAA